MSTVKFANGKEIEASVYGASLYFQNSQRQTLEFIIPEELYSFDEMKSLWKDSHATSEITITSAISDGETAHQETSVHLNFTIPVEMKYVQSGDSYNLRFKLAQKSELEIAQEKQAIDISACESAIIDIGELLGGE